MMIANFHQLIVESITSSDVVVEKTEAICSRQREGIL